MTFHSSKAVKIATGSSHCSAIVMGGMTASVHKFTPVVFAWSEDQNSKKQLEAPQKKQRPFMSKIVISQAFHQHKQDALSHMRRHCRLHILVMPLSKESLSLSRRIMYVIAKVTVLSSVVCVHYSISYSLSSPSPLRFGPGAATISTNRALPGPALLCM